MSYNSVFQQFHSVRDRVARQRKRSFTWPIRTVEQRAFTLGRWNLFNGQSMRKEKLRLFVEVFFRTWVTERFLYKQTGTVTAGCIVSSSFQGKLTACVFAVYPSPPLTSTRRAFVYPQQHQVTLLPCSDKFRGSIRFGITLCFISQESTLAAVLLSFPPVITAGPV